MWGEVRAFKTGSDPAGRPPWARFRPPPASTGVSPRLRPRVLARFGHFSASRVVNRLVPWRYNSRGGDWFRLRWLIQWKRPEGCGCDLVNPVTAKLQLP